VIGPKRYLEKRRGRLPWFTPPREITAGNEQQMTWRKIRMAKVKIECQFCSKLNAVDLAKHNMGPKCAECGKPFHLDRPVKVSEKHFDATVTRSPVPVLVDFYADWCAPCRQMAPILDEIARDRVGKILVAKVDTDAAPMVGQRYGIRSIPYFARFENGTIVKDVVGAVGRGGLQTLAG